MHMFDYSLQTLLFIRCKCLIIFNYPNWFQLFISFFLIWSNCFKQLTLVGSFQIDHLTLSRANSTKRVKHATMVANLKDFHLNYKYAMPSKSINKHQKLSYWIKSNLYIYIYMRNFGKIKLDFTIEIQFCAMCVKLLIFRESFIS